MAVYSIVHMFTNKMHEDGNDGIIPINSNLLLGRREFGEVEDTGSMKRQIIFFRDHLPKMTREQELGRDEFIQL